MKHYGAYVAIGFIAILIIVGVSWAFTYFSADTRGAIDQQELVRADGRFRLQSYEHFFNLCATIQTAEMRIDALETENKTASEFRQRELGPAITAAKIKRVELINQYNVDAEKEGSVGIFRSNKLPAYINKNVKETECVYQ